MFLDGDEIGFEERVINALMGRGVIDNVIESGVWFG